MLKEPVALVTGASSGIGRAIAQKLSKQGLRVFGTSRDAGRVEAIPGVELLSLDVDSDESEMSPGIYANTCAWCDLLRIAIAMRC